MFLNEKVSWPLVIRDLLFGVLLFLIIEAAVFRTDYYRSRLAPLSYAGWVQELVERTRLQEQSATTNVIVLGDSRIAEGFSAKTGDRLFGEDGVKFLNVGIPGSSMRVWYYMLRELDPQRQNYKVIFIPLNDQVSASNDRGLDLQFLTPLVRYEDVIQLPWTFASSANRVDAVFECLLKGYAYRRDVMNYLSDRSGRETQVLEWRLTRGGAEYDYPGNSGTLDGLSINPLTGEVSYPSDFTQETVASVEGAVARTRISEVELSDYAIDWLHKLRAHYAGTGTRIVLGTLPRGPIPTASDDSQPGTVTPVEGLPGVEIISQSTFVDLERPENFFDGLHLNARGRDAFSKRIAGYLAPIAEPKVGHPAWTWDDETTLRLQTINLLNTDSGLSVSPNSARTTASQQVQFPLPKSAPPGTLRLQGTVPGELSSLLPVQIQAVASSGEITDLVVSKSGTFTLTLRIDSALTPATQSNVAINISPLESPERRGPEFTKPFTFIVNSVIYRTSPALADTGSNDVSSQSSKNLSNDD